MSSGAPLTVDRDSARGKRIGGLVMLFVAAGLGYLATLYGFMAGMGAFIFGAAGLSLVVASFTFSGTGPCPSCGAELRDVPRNAEGFGCGNCGAFCIVKDAHLFRTPDDHVAATSIYPVRVQPGQDPGFPPFCVTCGAAAVTLFPREMTKTLVGAPGVARIVRKWQIGIPLCATHQAPDSLGNPPGVSSFDGTVMISSYRVWQDTRRRQASAPAA